MAKRPSAYLVAIPKKAAIHIQKRAPGPPVLMAVATPTILPVPIVAASAVARAAKLEISPSPLSSAKDKFKGFRQTNDLQKSKTDCQVDTSSYKKDKKGRSPYKVINESEKV